MSSSDERTTGRYGRHGPHGRHGAAAGPRTGVPTWVRQGGTRQPDPAVLAALCELEGDGWTALHGLRRPGDAGVRIAHVAVGPGGVVVVAAPAGDASVRVTRQVLRSRAAEVGSVAAAVTVLLAPRFRTSVRGVLCLPAVRAGAVGGVAVLGPDDLARHLGSLPPRLSAVDAAGLAQLLELRLGGRRSPDLLTTAALTAGASGRAGRRRVVRPLTAGGPTPAGGAATDSLRRAAGAVLVAAAAWCAWTATTASLPFG